VTRILVAGNLSLDDTVSPGGFQAAAPGGDALYASLGAAAFGDRPEILTLVGEDYPDALVERMGSAGVDTGRLRRVDGATVHYRVTNAPDGSRRYEWISSADRLLLTSPGVVDYADLDGADWLHLAAMPIEAHEVGIAAARAAGVRYSVDPHEEYVLGFEERLRPLVRGAVFLPSELEVGLLFADLRTGDRVHRAEDAAERLVGADWQASLVAVKLGEVGVLVRSGERSVHVPAEPAAVVDTVGAGDAWCGAFIAAWLATGSPEVAAACGNVAAADTIGAFGAFPDGVPPSPAGRVARVSALLEDARLASSPGVAEALARLRTRVAAVPA
jgi:ribokinase